MVKRRYETGDLVPSVLTSDTDLSTFSCSKDDDSDVDFFIHNLAKRYQAENVAFTYVFKNLGGEIVGFISVLVRSIEKSKTHDREALEWFDKRLLPALFVGQLGTHNNQRGRNVGTLMLDFVKGLAIDLSQVVGCRYLWLETKQNKVCYYGWRGFWVIDAAKKAPIMVMRIPDKGD